MDQYFTDESIDELFRWQCGREECSASGRPSKRVCLPIKPPVLCVTLKRWNEGLTLTHHVLPNAEIALGDCRYTLRSIVVHLGSSASSGHYITIARHVTDTAEWWLYDDGVRRPATVDEIDCSSRYMFDAMKAYVLFYERVDEAPANAEPVVIH